MQSPKFLLLFISASLFLGFSNPVSASTQTTIYTGSLEKDLESGEIKVSSSLGTAGVVKTIQADGTTNIAYVHSDHLGSTVLVTDSSGNKLEGSDIKYYPYGEEVTPIPDTITQQASDRLYTGQRQDKDIDLYFYNARYYNPSIGRFLSADKAEGPNRYAYVGNNPVMRNDPSGNNWIDKAIAEFKSNIDSNAALYVNNQRAMGDYYASSQYRNIVFGGYAVAAGGAASIAFAPQIAAAATSTYVAIQNFATSHPNLIKTIDVIDKANDAVGCASGDPTACASGVPGMSNLTFNIRQSTTNINGGKFKGIPVEFSVADGGRRMTLSRGPQIIDIDLDDPVIQSTVSELTATYKNGGSVYESITEIFSKGDDYDNWVDGNGGRYSLSDAITRGTGVCIDRSCLQHITNAANGFDTDIHVFGQSRSYRGSTPGHATLRGGGMSGQDVFNQLNPAYGLGRAKATQHQKFNLFAE